MNYLQNISYPRYCFLIFICICIIVNSQINDNYELHSLNDEDGKSLIDVVDYHNLKLVVSSSGNIYKGIPPQKVSQTNAKLFENSAIASLNENYLLASCLEDSLLTKISIASGEYTSLLQYSDISTSIGLTIPENVCSISIFENLVFIAYSIINGEIKYNIVIRVNIESKDDFDGPTIDTNYQIKNYIYEEKHDQKLDSIRRFACEAIYISNDASNYRLICVHEIKDTKFIVNGFVINNNFEELESNGQEYSIYSVSSTSSFKLFRTNSFNIRVLSRKTVNDLSLTDNYGVINIIKTKITSNLDSYSSRKDLFDYNNNFITSSERYTKSYMKNKNFYYFHINKLTSGNYYKINLYSESQVLKVLCYYEELNDILVVIFQGATIKYFTLQNHKNLFEIDSFSYIIELKSNEVSQIKVDDIFNIPNYGNLQVYSKRTNNTENDNTLYFGGDNFPSNLINFDSLETDKSLNNWYDYNLAFIDNEIEHARLFILIKVYLYVRTCYSQCISCGVEYDKCDICKFGELAQKKDSDDANCYSINNTVEGYIYNLASNMLEKCYDSCKFCKKSSEESSSSEHNCESCKEGYIFSYQFLGNCYKINDSELNLDKKVNSITDLSFSLIDSCQNYKIYSTRECIDSCPTSKIYSNYPPKYLFNKICYDSCPLNTIPDESNNNCICNYSFHIDNEKLICYDNYYCINNTYKYYLNDSKECISSKSCPEGYYQFNFQCYKNKCPSQTNEISNTSCQSIYNYCYVNEYFQTICDNNSNDEYIYKFDDTVQYLKKCEDSIMYTTSESKTYFYNNTCYLECPKNTVKNESTNKCDCLYYKYNVDDNNYICYSKEEKCLDKIPVIDLKICLDDIKGCKDKNYKIFNNECYSQECPNNTKIDNNNEYMCKCKNYYYGSNKTLNCFEDSISCEMKNYSFSNPITYECYDSLNDCFYKGNSYYFNNFCYKDDCPSEYIPLSSTNETIQKYFIKELSLNDSLKNKICICDIIYSDKKWNKTILNEIECLNTCEEGYEPELLTHKCVEKCNPDKHFNFNDKCYKEDCPPGTKLNSTEDGNGKKICVCESSYKINNTNNFMICLNDNIQFTMLESTESKNEDINTIMKSSDENGNIQSTIPEITEPNNESINTIIKSSDRNDILKIVYPDEYYKDPDLCLAVYENKCYLRCPEDTCLTIEDPNLVYCIPILSETYIFNDICFFDFKQIINNIKNISENIRTISVSPNISINVYTTKTAYNFSLTHTNLSIIFLNQCEQLLLDYYNLTNDTTLYIIGIDSPNKNKSYVIDVYNYGVFLENGFQLDHLNVCQNEKITIVSPIKDTDSIKIEEAKYFSDFGYDIYNASNMFYTEYCAPASINGNDITLVDRKNDFYPSDYILCNESCEYTDINFNTNRFICECNLSYNFSEEYQYNNIEEIEENISYIDYFISLFNYKIISCYKLLFEKNNYYNNLGFFISFCTFIINLIQMIIYLTCGVNTLKRIIIEGMPNKSKLKQILKTQLKTEINKEISNKIKTKNKNIKNTKKTKNSQVNYYNFIYINQSNKKNPPKKNKKQLKNRKEENNKSKIKKIGHKKIKGEIEQIIKDNFLLNKKNERIHINNFKNKNIYMTSDNTKIQLLSKNYKINKVQNNFNLKGSNNKYKYKGKRKQFYELSLFEKDKIVDKKEINHVPYSQALRIDRRDYLQILISVLANEIQIISIFYYNNPYLHLSLSSSMYFFQLLMDLTLNCFLYTDEYISEKYKNGELKIITSILLSTMSNIFTYFISYFICELLNFTELLEMIIKFVVKKYLYLINIIKFKKYMKLKLAVFYSLEFVYIICMCYYLTIFCIVYSETQLSFLMNYIIGVIDSLLLSIVFSFIISFLRYASLKFKFKQLYNISKYLYEKF